MFLLKRTLLVICTVFLFSCANNENLNNCIQAIPINFTTDLNNPQLINVQTPGGFVELNGGSKGILLFNKNGNEFAAFDKLCPNDLCDTPMTFENRLLKCTCDDTAYSVDFGGAPQNNETLCPAIEYRVTTNGSVIRISNF